MVATFLTQGLAHSSWKLSMAFNILKRMKDLNMVKDPGLRVMSSSCLLPVRRPS